MSKHGQMDIQSSDLLKNIVGKGEIACYEQFVLFSKAVCCWCVKISIYGVKGFKAISPESLKAGIVWQGI